MSDASQLRCLACDQPLPASPLLEGRFEPGLGLPAWAYALVRCTGCGMGRLTPEPTPACLTALYSTDYEAYRGDAAANVNRTSQRLKMVVASLGARALASDNFVASSMLTAVTRGAEVAFARSVPLTASVPLALPVAARILDFGCGAGFWLAAMRSRGYHRLAAFDVAQPALAKLAALGIECYADAAERLPDAAFDCIRLEHVLEHMVDPVGTLSLLARKLSRTGTIVLAVPNFGSYSASKLGANWQALKLPHHLSHFTVQALRRVAKRAGLGLKRVRFLPISELGVQRPRGAAGRVLWQAERFRYHLRHMGAPSGDFLSAELEVLG